jgi:hypothetical protein
VRCERPDNTRERILTTRHSRFNGDVLSRACAMNLPARASLSLGTPARPSDSPPPRFNARVMFVNVRRSRMLALLPRGPANPAPSPFISLANATCACGAIKPDLYGERRPLRGRQNLCPFSSSSSSTSSSCPCPCRLPRSPSALFRSARFVRAYEDIRWRAFRKIGRQIMRVPTCISPYLFQRSGLFACASINFLIYRGEP